MTEHVPPKARITLRKVSTGEVVTFIDDWTQWDWYKEQRAAGEDTADFGTLLFDWEENNHSCDSNRELEFYRAKGEAPPDRGDEPHHCCMGPNDTNEYELVDIEAIP